jgi:iron complex outermembrane receptor protein
MTNGIVQRLALLLIFLLTPSPPAGAAELQLAGTVRSASGDGPLAGTRVRLQGSPLETRTGPAGGWRLAVPPGNYVLEVTHHGYLTVTRGLSLSGNVTVDIELAPLYRVPEEVVVEAVRATARTPVTTHEVSRADINRRNVGQEMPFLLKPAPSLNQYSDTGLAAGYSYLYLRGMHPKSSGA